MTLEIWKRDKISSIKGHGGPDPHDSSLSSLRNSILLYDQIFLAS
jgi:hypothetical protein